ncbi:MAG: HEPN domain-containing protein [Chitinophagaceae bacterium]|nr:HEPN domain-containing protein [Chitinophagaceae bacterium]
MTEASLLKNYFYRLYQSLLETHVKSPTLIPTTEEEDCVKAFCVLAHAAVEEFVEKLCKYTLEKAYLKYKSKIVITKIPINAAELDKINLGIIQLIETLVLASSFSIFSDNSETMKKFKNKLEDVTQIYKAGISPTMNELATLTKKTNSYTKEILKETREFFRGHIESNHGASLKYLLRLLVPVGIDIPNSLFLNSLQKLAEYRGSYAHGRGVTQIISASDISAYAIDVIKLCSQIEKNIDDFEKI